ncbi:type II toxin-antitoxin system VapC family toxin [Paraburkholderia sp. Ac-20340]|uniref:type II toxin-antitoxin system VapC family toxin n=1 Tax=Paraburkholderia sp. Ac-20340 TaxID=2703888 RepID=UPI00198255A7|nr:type II toxin-antitoxin system VapC family toxin [Paraburkholderia sp. Ac-20340]MBN3853761.1 type II toxin-antitoxin system VapC family toxin [Paraburkholderia sp. Ac-20340]
MKITVDTNVLVRGVVRDDEKQARAVDKALKDASLIAIPLPCLCEFVWVLRRVYGFEKSDIATAIRALIATEKVAMNRPATEAGLAILEAGGDFADGVIAYDGTWLGADTFVSFDKKAVSLLTRQEQSAHLL